MINHESGPEMINSQEVAILGLWQSRTLPADYDSAPMLLLLGLVLHNATARQQGNLEIYPVSVRAAANLIGWLQKLPIRVPVLDPVAKQFSAENSFTAFLGLCERWHKIDRRRAAADDRGNDYVVGRRSGEQIGLVKAISLLTGLGSAAVQDELKSGRF